MTVAFVDWFVDGVGAPPDSLHLAQAFEIAVCRVEEAAASAVDPIRSLSNLATSSSRKASREMLLQLGYTDDQIRVVRRLLAGSTERWPGLMRLYASGEALEGAHRRYVIRQLRSFQALAVQRQTSSPE
jgi:hypothetical protein